MANVVNYHIHIRTSFSRDGWLLIWKKDPQKGFQTMERIRPMTKQEIINHVKYKRKYGLKIWLHRYVYEGLKW